MSELAPLWLIEVPVKYRTVCQDCAKKCGQMDAFRKSGHRIMAGFGPDSLCDLCGEEKGGAVIPYASE